MDPEFARTHPARRVLRLSLLSLFLGLVTTWLVAWGFGVWGSVRPPNLQDIPEGFISRERGYGVDYVMVAFSLSETESSRDVSHLNELASLDILPGWTRASRSWSSGQAIPAGAPAVGGDPQVFGSMWHEVAFGWPLPSLRCMTTGRIVLDGLTPPGWLPAMRDPNPLPALPYRPVWSGFLVDTLFFAVVWFMVGIGVGVARRRWHVSRGHCPWCDYDLRGCPEFSCPECGWRPGERDAQTLARVPLQEVHPKKRLVPVVALAIVVLVGFGIVWSLQSGSNPAPDLAALRQSARTYFSQGEGYSTVASYFDEHFDALADRAERELADDPSWKEDLRSYLTSIEIQFVLQVREDGRTDVAEYLWTVPYPPEGWPLD